VYCKVLGQVFNIVSTRVFIVFEILIFVAGCSKSNRCPNVPCGHSSSPCGFFGVLEDGTFPACSSFILFIKAATSVFPLAPINSPIFFTI